MNQVIDSRWWNEHYLSRLRSDFSANDFRFCFMFSFTRFVCADISERQFASGKEHCNRLALVVAWGQHSRWSACNARSCTAQMKSMILYINVIFTSLENGKDSEQRRWNFTQWWRASFILPITSSLNGVYTEWETRNLKCRWADAPVVFSSICWELFGDLNASFLIA